MTEHTPGPYRVAYDTRIEYGPIVAGKGFCVAVINRSTREWKANALLFAAAPETAKRAHDLANRVMVLEAEKHDLANRVMVLEAEETDMLYEQFILAASAEAEGE